ncbi:DUF2977 domain-containing protein [Pediococcus acidilactici]|uniref:DUF2977 domain-containing protein n=1 Tax=Pediococcus acidilactici TaxID=1254 RepID=UPI001950C94B|nr:DUF2977 domain-containing protein [Pediococcus acidilactici]MBM6644314.1 DUF2977 domain-containing protein [Pediococcus acidilactici]
MLLVLDDDNCIVKYSLIGGLADDNTIECDENELPEDFDVKFQPLFYKLENNEIIENPDYVEPADTPPVSGPSKQEKINAQIMLNQAKQKEEQDKFNAQILLKLAGGMK